jgi:hypothetical protein
MLKNITLSKYHKLMKKLKHVRANGPYNKEEMNERKSLDKNIQITITLSSRKIFAHKV